MIRFITMGLRVRVPSLALLEYQLKITQSNIACKHVICNKAFEQQNPSNGSAKVIKFERAGPSLNGRNKST